MCAPRVCKCWWRPEGSVRSYGAEVTGVYELSCGCWEANPVPLQKQRVLLTTLQSLEFYKILSKITSLDRATFYIHVYSQLHSVAELGLDLPVPMGCYYILWDRNLSNLSEPPHVFMIGFPWPLPWRLSCSALQRHSHTLYPSSACGLWILVMIFVFLVLVMLSHNIGLYFLFFSHLFGDRDNLFKNYYYYNYCVCARTCFGAHVEVRGPLSRAVVASGAWTQIIRPAS